MAPRRVAAICRVAPETGVPLESATRPAITPVADWAPRHAGWTVKSGALAPQATARRTHQRADGKTDIETRQPRFATRRVRLCAWANRGNFLHRDYRPRVALVFPV